MIPTPAILARLRRRMPAVSVEPKPIIDPQPAVQPEPATVEEAAPVRVIPVVMMASNEPPRLPPRTWVNATFTEADEEREAAVLSQLARLTDRYGPRGAALRLFGGHR